MRRLISFLAWVIRNQAGVEPWRLGAMASGVPRFFRDYRKFNFQYKGLLSLKPCLIDWNRPGGDSEDEYFWLDLFVARKVFNARPERHVDVGSRMDGFVAHVASFRDVEFLDIRNMQRTVPGVTFKQADITSPEFRLEGYCDSLSCLHALEHFGLGRYGDPIDNEGARKALKNLAGLLRPQGLFYLAVPIGVERVEFNAHRVFDPVALMEQLQLYDLKLESFAWIERGHSLVASQNPASDIHRLRNLRYNLGIFTLVKAGGG